MDILSYDAYLFDFDGLLVNTEDLHYLAYKEMLERHGFSLEWDFATYCENAHKSTEYLANAVYSAFPKLQKIQPDWMILREQKQSIYTDLLRSGKTELMPGVKEFLSLLKERGKPMFVVTNSPKKQVEIIKEQLIALSLIDTWITREFYNDPKPSPECYLVAIKHFGKDGKFIGFEDTPKGLEALLQTPITPVLVLPKRYPAPEETLQKKVYCFESFHEMVTSA